VPEAAALQGQLRAPGSRVPGDVGALAFSGPLDGKLARPADGEELLLDGLGRLNLGLCWLLFA
jgi:hypothetical protein